jgi:uncharacterized protein (TIGR02001 family)
MFKKTIIAGLVAGAFAPALAFAQAAAPAPTPEHTLTGNVGVYSQYIFRGLTQTNGDAALQGGFDYSHSSGFYAGTWMSNISWLTDTPTATGYASSSLEMDFYAGYTGTVSGDLGFDVGLLQYYYPGTKNSTVPYAAGMTKADTLEVYGALTWKWLSAKYSYSLNKQTFGVQDSDGTTYLDLTANYPVNDKFNLIAHYGIQKFTGNGGLTCTGGVGNDACASYKDWKLGATYALPQSFTIGGYWTGTDMTSAQEANYTNTASTKMIGKDTFTLFVAKTF